MLCRKAVRDCALNRSFRPTISQNNLTDLPYPVKKKYIGGEGYNLMAGTFDTFYSLSSREEQLIRLFVTQIVSHIKGRELGGDKGKREWGSNHDRDTETMIAFISSVILK